jgi:hypothetical protein
VSDAQVNPLATTETTLLTVPAGYTYEGRIFVAEQGAATPTFRIALRLDAAALAAKHYIVYGDALAANEAWVTEMLYLPENAIVTVYASTANVSFTFSGLKRQLDVNF